MDLLPAIEGVPAAELTVSGRDPHPNERAHALFAKGIREGLYEEKSE